MNIEKIKYFIDLVECGNFTYTAQKNYVSQTTISQQLNSLEKEFNIQLINRKVTPVEPTEAGELFYKDALVLWRQYQLMKSNMYCFSKDNNITLKIAYSNITDIKNLLTFLPKFKEKKLNITYDINKIKLKNISEFLRKGIYDFAVCLDSEFIDKNYIDTTLIEVGKYLAIVNSTHPLFKLNKIPLNELYQYPLIMLDESLIGSSYKNMITNAKNDGYTPNIQRTSDDIETELFYIVTENLIGFAPENFQLDDNFTSLKLIPIEDSHHTYRIVLAKLKENKNPIIKSLIDSIDIDKSNSP